MGITSWPLPEKWDDVTLHQKFLHTTVKTNPQITTPDWSVIHQELKPKTMTLQLLWEEYRERNNNKFYSYNHFCRLYKNGLAVKNHR